MTRTTLLSLSLALAANALPTTAGAQPQHVATYLGPAVTVNDMNLAGDCVGWTVNTVVRAYVAGPNRPFQLLPHPAGYQSAWAQGINDAGVIVGSASTGGFPGFGQAVAWFPDGLGGYTTQLLGQLPGHTQSVAYDVNDRGEIVGQSITPGFQGGPTVWFNSPSGVLNLSALGAPSGVKEINDEGVLTGTSGGLFDIDTLVATPLPPLPSGQSGYQGWAINDRGELAGTAFYGSQRAAARWTIAGGWQAVSGVFGQSANVTAFDINDHGLTVLEAPTPSAHFDGIGTFPLATLLVPSQLGNWSFGLAFGGACNDVGQIAAIGTNLVTGESGAVLLTPVGVRDLGGGLAGTAGTPILAATGTLAGGSPIAVTLSQGLPSGAAWLVVGTAYAGLPFEGGTLVPSPQWLLGPLPLDASGALSLATTWPAGVPLGFSVFLQAWVVDPAGPAGWYAASNGLALTQP